MHRKGSRKDVNSDYLWVMANCLLLICSFPFETFFLFGNSIFVETSENTGENKERFLITGLEIHAFVFIT